MKSRIFAVVACLVLSAGTLVIAQPVDLAPDGSATVFVSIDGRILEITNPDGATADPDDPSGTGWDEVLDLSPNLTGDLLFSPDGNLNFSVPGQNAVGRTTLDGGTVDYAGCADSTCEPLGLGLNYRGDLLAVDGSDTGGILRWTDLVGLYSDGVNPAFLRYPIGGGATPAGMRVGGSDLLPGDWVAIQEWYTGELASILATSSSGGKGNGKGGGGKSTSLNKSADPAYGAHSQITGLDSGATDLAISQAQIFYTTGDDVIRIDLATGSSHSCTSIPGKVEARYISGDVGGVLYVASVTKKEISVHQIDYSMTTGNCGAPLLLKKFLTRDFGKNLGGLASTYSTLSSGAAIADDGVTRTFLTMPDGMHKYRYTAVCPAGGTCVLSGAPTLLLTALESIEGAADPDNPDVANPSRGLPFNLPGQGFPWEYESDGFDGFDDPYIGEAEFHEFSTAITGTNFRLSCCPASCAGADCSSDFCEFGALQYALPISSEIVPDPRGTRRGTGSVCYESLTSTLNAGDFAAEFCGWNSPLVSTPPDPFDIDAFFCGPSGVTSVSHGANLPVKFNVGAYGDPCTSSNAPPYDLNVLFSAGLVGYCTGGTFMAADEVQAVLGLVPNGEGEVDPFTGQVKFAKAGPKKQYQFNLDTGQVPLLNGSGPMRTIVLINATFLEDSIEDGDQSVFVAIEP